MLILINYSSDYEAIFQDDFTDIDSSSDTEEIMNSNSDEENKLLLIKMGYSEAEASIAMEMCFGVLYQPDLIIKKTLLEDAIESPYFYYENVTLAPVGVWTEMSRFPLISLPCTIHEAFPLTKWWPSWDIRTKLNCLQTCTGSAKLTERIRKALEAYDDELPSSVQKYVLVSAENGIWYGLEGIKLLHLNLMSGNASRFP
ncbi:hypothetical protein F3Y22_tig00000764pilonHSYRG00001 [Hibiscus syriacus]|uniref:DNA (Cytosine-5)-methyltransferase DRM1/2 n=1 Tax=Hibiscus syriacus TaxID=106335 RepID=A0A6A3D548_HIBSY|nr:hypothetical protein F3Y22_tig00000764pilonHSYRG00001 [Hibiscus syriacus]